MLSKLPKESRRRVVSYLAGIIEEDQMKAAKIQANTCAEESANTEHHPV